MPTLYKKGVAFKKAGVMLSGLSSKNEQQGHLFGNQPKTNEKSEKVMAVMDQINKRFKSKDMVFIGSQGVKRDEKTWQGRRNKTTPRYTTKWAELPIVR